MKTLFKIYGKDFAINALYLFLLVLFLGGALFFIMQGSERIGSILTSLFVTFNWILFFYSYPLTQCLKWALYTPLSKKEIIFFNIIFQIYKIIIIGLLGLLLRFLVRSDSTPTEKLVLGLNVQKIDWTKYVFSTDSPFWSTFLLAGILLVTIGAMAVIFNVSPRLIIENKGGVKIYTKFKTYKFILQKYWYWFALLIPLAFVMKKTYGYWTSSYFVMAFALTFILFFTWWTYSQKLVLAPFWHRLIIPSGILFFIFLLSFFYGYSTYRLDLKNLSLPAKLEEFNYLKNFGPTLELKDLLALLKSDLDSSEVKDVLKSLYSKDHKKNIQGILLKDEHFSSIIFSKKKPEATFPIIESLPIETFKWTQLMVLIRYYSAMFNQSMDKNQNRIQSKEKDKDFVINELLLKYPFTFDQLKKLAQLPEDHGLGTYFLLKKFEGFGFNLESRKMMIESILKNREQLTNENLLLFMDVINFDPCLKKKVENKMNLVSFFISYEKSALFREKILRSHTQHCHKQN